DTCKARTAVENGGKEEAGPDAPPPGRRHLYATGLQYVPLVQALRIAGPLFWQHLPPDAEHPGWDDVAGAGEAVAPLLGISSRVWQEAVVMLGRRAAAAAVLLLELGLADRTIHCAPAWLRGVIKAAAE